MSREITPILLWIDERVSDLESDFITDCVSIEDQPLDDDGPEFLDSHEKEFEEYCQKRFVEAQDEMFNMR